MTISETHKPNMFSGRLRTMSLRYVLLTVALLSFGFAGSPSSASSAGSDFGSSLPFQDTPAHRTLIAGPLVGHVTPTSISVWLKTTPGKVTLTAWPQKEPIARISTQAEARAKDQGCLTITLQGLQPNTLYRYSFDVQDTSEGQLARTAPKPESTDPVTLAFVSCARQDKVTAASFDAIAARPIDVLLCIGDTPYIDTTDLKIQRQRYIDFNTFPSFAAIARRTPIISTWDDHDFGRNDTDGNVKGKENSRQAFMEHRPNPSFGDGKQDGIYTSFRRGPIETFVLDARWYAATEPSPADKTKPTLLGAKQYAWLCRALKASDAPVKALVTGMVWNASVRPTKTDHWGNYAHERDALFRFIGKNKISGVVLVGGDIHRSRVIRHPTTDLAGYPLIEFISSPIHDHIIASANQPHPGLLKDLGTPQTWLELVVTPNGEDLVTGILRSATGGELYRLGLSAKDLMEGK